MRNNSALLFKRLSSETEEILMDCLETLKGGGESDTIDGGDLDEVVITPDDPDDEIPPLDPDPEPDEDPFPEDEENPWDDWEDHGDGSETDEQEEEPKCTCELGLKEGLNSMIPGVTDGDNLLSNLKNFINDSKTALNNLTQAQVEHFGAAAVSRQMNALGRVTSLITKMEESDRSFRIEKTGVAGNSGYTTKDVAANQYVISINSSGNVSGDAYSMIHELVHIGQILDGEIGFNDNGVPTLLGLEDEMEAYQLMFDVEAGVGNTPQQATAEVVLAKDSSYASLPVSGGKCAVHG